jgi:hypothetical protein
MLKLAERGPSMPIGRRMQVMKRRFLRFVDGVRRVPPRSGDFIVAGMATMPSRIDTFEIAFASLIRQVDKLYLYLDGHSECPKPARNDPRVVPLLARDFPDLHANGKFLGLALEPAPCLYVSADDDLYYPYDFIATLRRGLSSYDDAAVVGYHGSILQRPLERYDLNRKTFAYNAALRQSLPVDVLGTGAVMFSSNVLCFDVRDWPFTNMVDLGLALEAARRQTPLISLARRRKSVNVLALSQADSISRGLKRDDTRQTKLAHDLLRLRDANTTAVHEAV